MNARTSHSLKILSIVSIATIAIVVYLIVNPSNSLPSVPINYPFGAKPGFDTTSSFTLCLTAYCNVPGYNPSQPANSANNIAALAAYSTGQSCTTCSTGSTSAPSTSVTISTTPTTSTSTTSIPSQPSSSSTTSSSSSSSTGGAAAGAIACSVTNNVHLIAVGGSDYSISTSGSTFTPIYDQLVNSANGKVLDHVEVLVYLYCGQPNSVYSSYGYAPYLTGGSLSEQFQVHDVNGILRNVGSAFFTSINPISTSLAGQSVQIASFTIPASSIESVTGSSSEFLTDVNAVTSGTLNFKQNLANSITAVANLVPVESYFGLTEQPTTTPSTSAPATDTTQSISLVTPSAAQQYTLDMSQSQVVTYQVNIHDWTSAQPNPVIYILGYNSNTQYGQFQASQQGSTVSLSGGHTSTTWTGSVNLWNYGVLSGCYSLQLQQVNLGSAQRYASTISFCDSNAPSSSQLVSTGICSPTNLGPTLQCFKSSVAPSATSTSPSTPGTSSNTATTTAFPVKSFLMYAVDYNDFQNNIGVTGQVPEFSVPITKLSFLGGTTSASNHQLTSIILTPTLDITSVPTMTVTPSTSISLTVKGNITMNGKAIPLPTESPQLLGYVQGTDYIPLASITYPVADILQSIASSGGGITTSPVPITINFQVSGTFNSMLNGVAYQGVVSGLSFSVNSFYSNPPTSTPNSVCPAGYTATPSTTGGAESCTPPLSCSTGYSIVNGQCVPVQVPGTNGNNPESPPSTSSPTSCPSGQALEYGVCVTTQLIPTICGAGQMNLNGVCVTATGNTTTTTPVPCTTASNAVAGLVAAFSGCSTTTTSNGCPSGLVPNGQGTCVAPQSFCPTGETLVNGICNTASISNPGSSSNSNPNQQTQSSTTPVAGVCATLSPACIAALQAAGGGGVPNLSVLTNNLPLIAIVLVIIVVIFMIIKVSNKKR